MNKKTKQILILFAICIVVYNIALFIITGFIGHSACFWLSYLFMMISVGVCLVSVIVLDKINRVVKDWLFGYPVLRHCFSYIFIEFILSSVFMLLDIYNCSWKVAFIVQVTTNTVFVIFIISSFIVKETIEKVEKNIETSLMFMKNLQINVEMVAEKTTNTEVKNMYLRLAEKVRYSDPVSIEVVEDVEKNIYQLVKSGDEAIQIANWDEAISCCKQADLLLEERNRKCKILK